MWRFQKIGIFESQEIELRITKNLDRKKLPGEAMLAQTSQELVLTSPCFEEFGLGIGRFDLPCFCSGLELAARQLYLALHSAWHLQQRQSGDQRQGGARRGGVATLTTRAKTILLKFGAGLLGVVSWICGFSFDTLGDFLAK